METLNERAVEVENFFTRDVVKGLTSVPKKISSKYLYDEKGDEYFQEIMKLPEYYLTRCETEILETYKEELLQLCCENEPFKLVDLGAGDATKTEILIKYFLKKNLDFEYIPIDISDNALKGNLKRLTTKYPDLKARGIKGDYHDCLNQLSGVQEKKFVLFMGSNIGNFDQRDAVSFLTKIQENLNQGDLLMVGLDLKKNPKVILDAYDDARGVTANFNYNLLERINKELDADFDVESFKHYCTYDPVTGEVKSYLVSRKDQNIRIGSVNKTFHFNQWETVQTEASNKYDISDVAKMADKAGFSIVKSFFDRNHYFTDSIWKKVTK